MHERVRRELWGYAPDEALSNEDLIAERYQGIRPGARLPGDARPPREGGAVPACSDAEAAAGMQLTESMAMLPAASVSGLYLWHPDAHYFGIGRIGRDQLEDYARRAGLPLDEAARWLSPEPRRRRPALSRRAGRRARTAPRGIVVSSGDRWPRSPAPRRRLQLAAAARRWRCSPCCRRRRRSPRTRSTAPPRRHAAPSAGARRPFRINLAQDGDYVRQSNFVQCVGASVQMMLNIMEPGADRTRRTQRKLQAYARATSGPRPDGRVRSGRRRVRLGGRAQQVGRRAGTSVVGADTLQQAMRIAARAIVKHRRPVGLLVWQGRHAWVMSGFEATGDPRDGDFRVTRAYILDPLHPTAPTYWGPSPDPGTLDQRPHGRPPVRPPRPAQRVEQPARDGWRCAGK